MPRYEDIHKVMDSLSLHELILTVRRQSQAFSRGSSAYRGVTKHPATGVSVHASAVSSSLLQRKHKYL